MDIISIIKKVEDNSMGRKQKIIPPLNATFDEAIQMMFDPQIEFSKKHIAQRKLKENKKLLQKKKLSKSEN